MLLQAKSLLTVLMGYLLNLKLGPGEYRVYNDPTQVRRFDNGFMVNGNYDLKNGVRFRLWTRENPFFAQEIVVWNRRSLYSSKFDNKRLTKIFLHGSNHRSNEKRLDQETAFVRDAYTTFADVNFILMDWTKLAMQTNYGTNSGDIAAERLAQFLHFLNNNGTPLESIHIIGHSWGAHVAGKAGMSLGGRVGRITGIDPAGPFYGIPFNYNPKRRLDKSDAQFVDVIHVDSGRFLADGEAHLGIMEPLGHVDFYPAGGKRQPSCPPKSLLTARDFFCSHERGIYYFAESIGSPLAFPSCRCGSWEKFSRNQCGCIGDDMSFMGEHAPRSRRGQYFLNVRSTGPKFGTGPQAEVVLRSITRAPNFIETETKSTLELGKFYESGGRLAAQGSFFFQIPNYSSRNFARLYKDDVLNNLFAILRGPNNLASNSPSSISNNNTTNSNNSTRKP